VKEDAAIHNIRLMLRIYNNEETNSGEYLFTPAHRNHTDYATFSREDVAYLLAQFDALVASIPSGNPSISLSPSASADANR